MPWPQLYPLRFEPIFRRYLWGGRRLATELHKPLGPGDDYAESWEICDRGDDQTRVHAGSLAGTSLGELVRNRGAELLGRHHPQPRFPLLLKFLDCRRDLSVQVHPNDRQAAQLAVPDLGKTEAWYILAADPGSRLWAGLQSGIDRESLRRHVHDGNCAVCLHSFQPRVGDCVFLPAGVVHALGAGLLVAEIQQSSDTTFRLFDWNRVDAQGRARELHVEQGLDVIDFDRGPVAPQVPQPTDQPFAEQLVECDQFELQRWALSEPQSLGGDNRCYLLAVVQGAIDVAGDALNQPLTPGQTMLVPAACGSTQLAPHGPAVVLVACLP